MVDIDKIKYLEYCKMTEEQVKELSSSFNHDDLVDFCIYLLKEKEFLKLDGLKTLLDIAACTLLYFSDKILASLPGKLEYIITSSSLIGSARPPSESTLQ